MDLKLNVEINNLTIADIISLSSIGSLAEIISTLQQSEKVSINTNVKDFKEVKEAAKEKEKPIQLDIISAEELKLNQEDDKKVAKQKYAELVAKIANILIDTAKNEYNESYVPIPANKISLEEKDFISYVAVPVNQVLSPEEKDIVINDPIIETLLSDTFEEKGYIFEIYQSDDREDPTNKKLYLIW